MPKKKEEDFGAFGSVEPVGKKRRFFSFTLLLKLLLLSLLLPLIPLGMKGWSQFYMHVLERDPPIIEILNPPPGIGVTPVELKIRVEDELSGIDEVIVRTQQGDQVRTILQERYRERLNEDTLTVRFEGRDSGLREGRVQISVVAFDRSFWSTSAIATVELPVDFRPPGIEIVSTQHNVVRGGIELVFYRVIAEEDVFSGVTVGAELFPGFAARRLDEDFSAIPDLHFAFFAIPLEFDADSDAVRVIARDQVGNISSRAFFYRVLERRHRTHKANLSRQFMLEKVDQLYEQYLKDRAKIRGTAVQEFLPAVSDQETIERFKVINGVYRELIEEVLQPLYSRPKMQRYWRGPFLQPGGRWLPYSYGDTVELSFGGQGIGTHTELGQGFVVARGNPVRAGNDGVVIFSGPLGPFGNALIIDHGFGVNSAYYHLERALKSEGDRVERGQEVAEVGDSGLAERPTLAFEVRLHGTPVRPAEWWDARWQKGHIDDKILDTKRRLGMQIAVPLD